MPDPLVLRSKIDLDNRFLPRDEAPIIIAYRLLILWYYIENAVVATRYKTATNIKDFEVIYGFPGFLLRIIKILRSYISRHFDI